MKINYSCMCDDEGVRKVRETCLVIDTKVCYQKMAFLLQLIIIHFHLSESFSKI